MIQVIGIVISAQLNFVYSYIRLALPLGKTHNDNKTVLVENNRKLGCKNLKIKTRNILKQCKNGKQLSLSSWCAINSYDGWIKWCNGFNLSKKYIYPLKSYSEKYYKEVIKSESKKHS